MSLPKVSEEFLKIKTNEFDIETIYVLSLSDQGIFDLGCLGLCENLVQLDLSKNNLSSVMVLRTLTLLQYLNLSENRLSALSGLEHLEALEYLNVAGNYLNSVDSLLSLTKLNNLETLVLQELDSGLSNPVLDFISNQEILIRRVKDMIPSLVCLDGRILSGEGVEFNEICSKVNNNPPGKDLKKCLDSLLVQKPFQHVDPPFVRIGFEENKTYSVATELSEECKKLGKSASDILDKMRHDHL